MVRVKVRLMSIVRTQVQVLVMRCLCVTAAGALPEGHSGDAGSMGQQEAI